MSGGFIVPTETSTLTSASSSRDPAAKAEADTKPSIPGTDAQPLLRLTPRQEGRLRIHVDGKLGELERDNKTRQFRSLPLLLSRVSPLLQLILQIPPIEPWSSLRTSYLLALTGSIVDYITSLPLVSFTSWHPPPPQDTPDNNHSGESESPASREEQASANLKSTLDFLNGVERGWRAVLRGEGWVVDPHTGKGKAKRVEFAGEVGLTERIRLRSIIISSRAKLLAWARSYGSFPGSIFTANGVTTSPRDTSSADQWETEVMGMWNGILDVLSRDTAAGGRDADEDEDVDNEYDVGEG